ncbi:MAG: hypothetical protein WBQ66_17830, partial [Blastocatellia bacterium]
SSHPDGSSGSSRSHGIDGLKSFLLADVRRCCDCLKIGATEGRKNADAPGRYQTRCPAEEADPSGFGTLALKKPSVYHRR